MSQPSDGNTNPAPATPPFFLTEGVSDLAMTYFYGHLFVARVSLGSVRNMSWSKYGEFLAFAVVLIVIPGPDFAVVTKNTLVGGHRRGRWTALGVSNSNLVQGTAAAFGLSALIVKVQPLFESVKWAGVGYLAYLGVQALRSARRGEYAPLDGSDPAGTAQNMAGWRQGSGLLT
jgi:threonine/homoserine/homoserine lactone efflux protein